jgi:Pup-like protein.
MAQKQVQKQKSQVSETHAEDSNVDVTNAELAQKTDQVVASIDDVLEDQLDEELLADIDGVLEEDAQAFVDAFVQQGGQ